MPPPTNHLIGTIMKEFTGWEYLLIDAILPVDTLGTAYYLRCARAIEAKLKEKNKVV